MLFNKASVCLRWSLIATSLVLSVVLGPDDALAIDPVRLNEQRAKSEQSERDFTAEADVADALQGQVPRDRDRAERDQDGDLSRGTFPRFQPPNLFRRGFVLGVQVQYLETGARITRVIPGTPAWRYGLEPGDVIVAIEGYQIGYVRGRLYDLPSELNARARRMGWVRLLVQNVRNDQLLNIDVYLSGKGSIIPRERELDVPLDSVDPAEAAGPEPDGPTNPARGS